MPVMSLKFAFNQCRGPYWRASEASEMLFSHVYGSSRLIFIYSILHILTIVFPDTCNVEYLP